MSILAIIGFLGLVTGCFLILGLSPYEFTQGLLGLYQPSKKTISDKVKEVQKPKEIKGIRKILLEAKQILVLMGKKDQFGMICVISLFTFMIGVMIALLLDNFYLVPIMGVGFALLPFWYIIFTSNFYKKQVNAELETALSIITTSYLRSESILSAVEENIEYLNPPVVEVFKSFLTESSLVSVNIKQSLQSMKLKINNSVFQEWVDAMISCQEDKSLKSTLTPIVSKLSDLRIVSADLDYVLYEPMKEFITMAILLVGNIPLIWFLNKEWYHTLMHTQFGKIILAVCGTVLFVSLAAVIKHTRPIEYKR